MRCGGSWDTRTALIDEPWPAVDAAALETVDDRARRAGERQTARAHFGRGRTPTSATVRDAALADANVQKFVGAAAVRKVIIVPGKLVNIVV